MDEQILRAVARSQLAALDRSGQKNKGVTRINVSGGFTASVLESHKEITANGKHSA